MNTEGLTNIQASTLEFMEIVQEATTISLAKVFDISRETALYRLEVLVGMGFLEVERRHRGRPPANVYRFHTGEPIPEETPSSSSYLTTRWV
jgi:predicted ArsR family transcriptional regulator